ncbi:MAG: hypothetical protein ACK41T_00665 [Pseudobdellovibrio sp.]
MLSAQGLSPTPLEINDFSGGMTDNPIGASINKFFLADNFYLSKVGNKAKLLTRPAAKVFTNERIVTNSKINSIFDIEEKLFQISDRRIFQSSPTNFDEILGVGGNVPFNLGNADSRYSHSTWQKHTIITNDYFSNVCKLFKDNSNWTVHNLGLPKITGNVTLTPVSSGSTYIYNYAYHYFYEYVNQGVTFAEQGPIHFQKVTTNAVIDGTNTVTHTPPPAWTLSNGSTHNYDLANLKIKIYRTTSNGTTYYYNATTNHNFTTYVDNIQDVDISKAGSNVLYTNGADDIPQHSPPPPAKYSHVVNDILCLGYVEENGQRIPNKARFSNRYSLWSCPEEFYEEFDEEIVGISSVNIYPIYLCKNKIYRVEGYYLPDGSGAISRKLISSTAGCMSHKSIVQTDEGIFWCGNDGFYFTDGYNVTRISDDLSTTYLKYINTSEKRERIVGSYFPKLKLVKWVMRELDSRVDNDKVFCLHLQAGISTNMPFTTWSGGNDRENFLPTYLHHVAGVMYFSDNRGYFMFFDEKSLSDHRIDIDTPINNWINKTIIYDYISPSFDFGSDSIKKWITKFFLSAENTSSLSLQAYSNNDNSGSYKMLKEIATKGNISYGQFDIVFGDPTVKFNYFPIINVKRGFPLNGLRCFYKQIRLTNAFTEIASSVNVGVGTFNSTLKTITVSGSVNFPLDCLDYYVLSSFDNYNNMYRILTESPTTLTLEDALNTLPNGNYEWIIKGYRRNEIVRIISYTINYSLTQQSAEPYKGAS